MHKSKQPFITIITCTKNRSRYLEQCLKSVEGQTFPDYEHLIVDGLSTDNTLNVINNYISRNKEKNIKVIQAEPKGISNAMNVGISNATGRIIQFLHDDDRYLNNTTLERAAKYFIKDKKLNWIIGNVVIEFKGYLIFIRYNPILQKQFNTFMSLFNWIPHENTFMKKSLFKRYGVFNEELKQNMDYDLWTRIIGKERPLLVNEDFTIFTVQSNSASSNPRNWPRIAREYIKIWKQQKMIPLVGSVKDSPIYINVKKISKRLKPHL